MTTLYTGIPPRLNPHTPPRKLRRSWRAPFTFEVCRYVLAYRLLGFDVASVSTVAGVSVHNVKYILQIFGGHMPRRRKGFGSIIWNKGYTINAEAHKKLGLPPIIPLSVDHADGGPETLEGIDVRFLKLPEPEWRPETDGYSDWTYTSPWLE